MAKPTDEHTKPPIPVTRDVTTSIILVQGETRAGHLAKCDDSDPHPPHDHQPNSTDVGLGADSLALCPGIVCTGQPRTAEVTDWETIGQLRQRINGGLQQVAAGWTFLATAVEIDFGGDDRTDGIRNWVAIDLIRPAGAAS